MEFVRRRRRGRRGRSESVKEGGEEGAGHQGGGVELTALLLVSTIIQETQNIMTTLKPRSTVVQQTHNGSSCSMSPCVLCRAAVDGDSPSLRESEALIDQARKLFELEFCSNLLFFTFSNFSSLFLKFFKALSLIQDGS